MFFEQLETRSMFAATIPLNPPPPPTLPPPPIEYHGPVKMVTGAYDGTNNGATATSLPSKSFINPRG